VISLRGTSIWSGGLNRLRRGIILRGGKVVHYMLDNAMAGNGGDGGGGVGGCGSGVLMTEPRVCILRVNELWLPSYCVA